MEGRVGSRQVAVGSAHCGHAEPGWPPGPELFPKSCMGAVTAFISAPRTGGESALGFP